MTASAPDPHGWQRPTDRPADGAARPASARLVDPEDDLAAPTSYGGSYGTEPATTAIPRYDAPPASNVSPAAQSPSSYQGLGAPEPLPYVQPGPRYPGQTAEPTEIEPEATREEVRAAGRRGTQDAGLMVLRVGLGALLIAHGLQKAFGWWGGTGLSGFRQDLANLGYQHAGVLTYVGAGAQVAIGVLLVLGLFTPLAAAAAVAYLINSLLAAVTAQPDAGYFPFFLPEGHEYQVTLIVVAAALTLTGPGRWGFDAGRGWARRPFVGSFLALLVGVGGGIAFWVLLNGSNPLA